MLVFQISRREFKRLGHDVLETFAENVVKNCAGKPAYAVAEPFIMELQNALTVYHAALVAALDRSISAINRKRAARKQIEEILERIAKTLEVHATEEAFVTDAGFRILTKRPTALREIPMPLSVNARSTGNRGEVLVQVAVESPRVVKMNAFEYSTDDGATWTNGTYRRRGKFVMHDLPSHKQLLLRARSIGSEGRVSAWSEPVVLAVL